MTQRDFWEGQWSRPGFTAPWLGRGISAEIVAAVADGWFRAGAPALDIGCGQGEVAAWLAARGFPAVGVDIAPTAIVRAKEQFGERPGKLDFVALDICAEAPPDRSYEVLVDRGCLHQIPLDQAAGYLERVRSVASPTARMLLFVKAFRSGIPFGDAAERARVTSWVESALSPTFEVVHSAPTYLDPFDGRVTDRALPGQALWLQRRSDERVGSAGRR